MTKKISHYFLTKLFTSLKKMLKHSFCKLEFSKLDYFIAIFRLAYID